MKHFSTKTMKMMKQFNFMKRYYYYMISNQIALSSPPIPLIP
ncbi:hypothetical protein [Aureivirga sp. CE67]|nr:hypothetical protein [Aureivirga sp. CE67]